MAEDLKVYSPTETEEVPFPQEGVAQFGESQQSAGQSFSPKVTEDVNFPDPRMAHELISRALNTRSKKILQEFTLTEFGGLRIGKYQQGVSGEVLITGGGLVAKNSLGDETLVLDGETGDAIFAGIIQTGAIIAGRVIVGNNTWVIDGDQDAPRILLYNNGIPEILIGRRA